MKFGFLFTNKASFFHQSHHTGIEIENKLTDEEIYAPTNRTILELKCGIASTEKEATATTNRTILELKFITLLCLQVRMLPPIAPYWN
ncbi:hypothetical protein NC99_30380 [Sunxiuqinia dokdonensis]|uniref:Uncharacterized protein n=1 Tax=Sunxiuqinia dokdonensis TaxID=1409788 RepID=A0A0L8V6D1_9BACT|nr:hypothetical protein NC99_30380 [Sunxiuqinia dokdonensis]